MDIKVGKQAIREASDKLKSLINGIRPPGV